MKASHQNQPCLKPQHSTTEGSTTYVQNCFWLEHQQSFSQSGNTHSSATPQLRREKGQKSPRVCNTELAFALLPCKASPQHPQHSPDCAIWGTLGLAWVAWLHEASLCMWRLLGWNERLRSQRRQPLSTALWQRVNPTPASRDGQTAGHAQCLVQRTVIALALLTWSAAGIKWQIRVLLWLLAHIKSAASVSVFYLKEISFGTKEHQTFLCINHGQRHLQQREEVTLSKSPFYDFNAKPSSNSLHLIRY